MENKRFQLNDLCNSVRCLRPVCSLLGCGGQLDRNDEFSFSQGLVTNFEVKLLLIDVATGIAPWHPLQT